MRTSAWSNLTLALIALLPLAARGDDLAISIMQSIVNTNNATMTMMNNSSNDDDWRRRREEEEKRRKKEEEERAFYWSPAEVARREREAAAARMEQLRADARRHAENLKQLPGEILRIEALLEASRKRFKEIDPLYLAAEREREAHVLAWQKIEKDWAARNWALRKAHGAYYQLSGQERLDQQAKEKWAADFDARFNALYLEHDKIATAIMNQTKWLDQADQALNAAVTFEAERRAAVSRARTKSLPRSVNPVKATATPAQGAN